MENTRLFPELRFLETPAERKAAYKKALRQVSRRPRFWVYLVTMPIVTAVILVLLIVSLRRFVPIPPSLIGGLVGGLVGGSIAGLMQYTLRKPIQKQLRLQLVEKGIPVCVGCGYDLRGQSEARCPECGRRFDSGLLGKSG